MSGRTMRRGDIPQIRPDGYVGVLTGGERGAALADYDYIKWLG